MACRTGEACGLTETRSPALRWLEVQSRHDAHHRGRRCLVPADLQAVVRAADLVGVVDHADGQPQDAALDALEELLRLADRGSPGSGLGACDHGATIAGATGRKLQNSCKDRSRHN